MHFSRSAILIVLLSLLLSMLSPFGHSKTTHYPVAQIKADFTQLYTALKDAHYDLYTNLSKEEYDAQFDHFYDAITTPMTEAGVRTHFQRFVALGDVAHATIGLPVEDFMHYRDSEGVMLPLYPSLRGQRAFIDTYYGDSPLMTPGTEILSIDGKPISKWLETFSDYVSADNQTLANTLIELRFPFLMWLTQGEKTSFTVTVATTEGNRPVQVQSLSRSEQQRFVSETSDNDVNMRERVFFMLDNDIGYLRPGPFYNTSPNTENIWDATHFHQFIDNAFKFFISENANALVIDLRDNPGGTNSFSDHMLGWVAEEPFRFASDFRVKVSHHTRMANEERLAMSSDKNDISHKLQQFYDTHPDGQVFSFELPYAQPRNGARFSNPVYVLVNRYSYSNAVSVAAIMQDYGFGTVIGEKTADLATTFGAMEHFTLANTGIEAGYPKALIVRPNGDTQPRGVTPDIRLNISQIGMTNEAVIRKVTEAISLRLNNAG